MSFSPAPAPALLALGCASGFGPARVRCDSFSSPVPPTLRAPSGPLCKRTQTRLKSRHMRSSAPRGQQHAPAPPSRTSPSSASTSSAGIVRIGCFPQQRASQETGEALGALRLKREDSCRARYEQMSTNAASDPLSCPRPPHQNPPPAGPPVVTAAACSCLPARRGPAGNETSSGQKSRARRRR
jgi:hypothetical protein